MQRIITLSPPQPINLLSFGKALARSLKTVFSRAFGCRHSSLSRPFTRDGQTYRVCACCGMRRAFDPEKWKPYGPFYIEVLR